tara:strand:- start:3156 stop:4568 length:1413 start_codon:yes stop_codon:yes gene_type:complete
MAETLFDKIWNQHIISDLGDGNDLIYIDRIFLHERTGSVALKSLEERGISVRKPDQVFATIDHIVDTLPGRGDETLMPSGSQFIESFRESVQREKINFFDLNTSRQGIVHVVSPEQGIALPGITYICPDSHTCSLGALGALAWGVGSSECEHALATNTLVKKKPKSMLININGIPKDGVTAKDIILHLISKHGANGANGHAIEFQGETIDGMSIESRLTLCNMAVEFGAMTGIISPDKKTIEYISGKAFAPEKGDQKLAEEYWASLKSDDGAHFSKIIDIDASKLNTYVTWGTSPEHAIEIKEKIPSIDQANSSKENTSIKKALDYMGLEENDAIRGTKIDAAFIGSCTNSRLSDLRVAASILKGNKIAPGIKAICVPGSSKVKKEAESEGIDKIFKSAGFEWRESGCSMCFFAGGESFGEDERVISTTNRNFENRQGKKTRTHLASPATVAASAIKGEITAAHLTENET